MKPAILVKQMSGMENSEEFDTVTLYSSLELVDQAFYNRDTRIVAIELLGKYLVHEIDNKILIGKIVETEAYLGEIDPASHVFTGNSNRSSAFYQPGGYSYVYLSYGKHYCFNIITNPPRIKGAVLIRALEPHSEIDSMKKCRKVSDIHQLTNGPGKLTQALKINKSHNKEPLFTGTLTIRSVKEKIEYSKIGISRRIGISKAVDWQLRYFLINNLFVSGRRKLNYNKLKNVLELEDISYYTEIFNKIK